MDSGTLTIQPFAALFLGGGILVFAAFAIFFILAAAGIVGKRHTDDQEEQ